MSPIRRMSRRRAAIFGVIAALILALPMAVLASHQFDDVPTDHLFHNDIDALADAGITGGCSADNYCPGSFVTRGQMAAFLNRLGALAPGKVPKVNADKLDGIDSTGFVQHADVTHTHGGAWVSNGNFTVTPKHFTDLVQLHSAGAGVQIAQVALDAPTKLSEQDYGLKSVTICIHDNTQNATITNTSVYATLPTNSNLIFDATVRGDVTTCYAVSDATPNAVASNLNLVLTMNFSAAGWMSVSSVTSTWTPSVVALTELDDAGADPATTSSD